MAPVASGSRPRPRASTGYPGGLVGYPPPESGGGYFPSASYDPSPPTYGSAAVPSSGPRTRASRRPSLTSSYSRRSARHRSLPPFEETPSDPRYPTSSPDWTPTFGLPPSQTRQQPYYGGVPSGLTAPAADPGVRAPQWDAMRPPPMPPTYPYLPPRPALDTRPSSHSLPSRPRSNPMAVSSLLSVPTVAPASPPIFAGGEAISPLEHTYFNRSPPTSVALSTTASESSNAPSSAPLSSVSSNFPTPAPTDARHPVTPPLALADARLSDPYAGPERRYGAAGPFAPAPMPTRGQPVPPSIAAMPIAPDPGRSMLPALEPAVPEEAAPPSRRDAKDVRDVWDRQAF